MYGVWIIKCFQKQLKILIKKGENVRITLYNNSMMRHPMHLHGLEKNQFFMPFVGIDWRDRKLGKNEQDGIIFGQSNTKDGRGVFSIGANYTLP